VFVAVGLVATVGCAPKQSTDDEILFGRKRFNVIRFGSGQEAVFVSGTLTGEGVASRNNTMAIYCDQETMECTIIDVVQVGPKQVGDLQVPLRYEVTQWDPDIVVARSPDNMFCRRETISILKRSEAVVWVNEPINQSDALCVNAGTELRKWTIDDPLQWKAILPRGAR
jgi:hypothetical protein